MLAPMERDDEYSPEETARRRDEVIRRMAKTPPQHRSTSAPKKAKAGAKRKRAPASKP